MSELKSCDVNVLGSFQKQASTGGLRGLPSHFDDEQLLRKSVESKGIDRGRERTEGLDLYGVFFYLPKRTCCRGWRLRKTRLDFKKTE